MGKHIQADHIGSGLNWDDSTHTLTATGGTETLKYAGRYLDANADSDGTATFIDADTNTNGAWTFSLRDEDHTAGMHYHIRVDSGTDALTISRKTGSTKTISGKFAGQSLNAQTSFIIYNSDNTVRLKPDGANWTILRRLYGRIQR